MRFKYNLSPAGFIKHLLFLLLLSFTINTSAQIYSKQQLKRLEKMLETQKGIDKIHTLLELSEGYNNFQLDTALLYTREAGRLSVNYRYDWGKYKSLYCISKLSKKKLVSYKRIIQTSKICSDWFKKQNYTEDAIKADILYTSCLRMVNGTDDVQLLAENTLNIARQINNPSLKGYAWLNLKLCSPWPPDREKEKMMMDSAIFNFRKAKDSSALILYELEKLRNEKTNAEWQKHCFSALNKGLEWENEFFIRNVLNSIAHSYHNMWSKDSALYYINLSIELSKEAGDFQTLLSDLNMKSLIYYRYSDNEMSKKSLFKAMDICYKTNNNYRLSSSLAKAANRLFHEGKYEESINRTLEGIRIAKLIKDNYQVATFQSELGRLYAYTEQFNMAEQNYLESADWMDKNTSGNIRKRALSVRYMRLGVMFGVQEDYKQAITYFEMALEEEYQANIRISYWMSIMHIHLMADDAEKAEEVYQKILKENEPSLLGQVIDFEYLKGELMIALGQYQEGLESYQNYLKKIENPDQISISNCNLYLGLYKGYEGVGDYSEALEAYVKYTDMNDSLEAQTRVDSVKQIESDYQISLREAEIENLQKQQEIQDLKLVQQESDLKLRKSYNIALVTGVLFIILAGYGFFRRYKNRKERERMILKNQLELENVEAKQKAELAEVKNTLFANVSHEFRTPLTLIKVPVQNYIEKIPEDDRPIFKGVLNSTDQLLTMVDELLELAKMKAGDIELNKSVFNLSNFFAQIKSNFKLLFRDKNIELVWQNAIGLSQFEGDENRLKIVLNNLLNNAYNHTPENGRVTCKIEPSGKGALKIVVSNTGSNISDRDLPYIFDRYYRGNEKNYVGNGIGLSLCKQITEMHSGTIRVNNSLDNAVAFEVELPGLIVFEESKTTVKENTKIISVEEVEPIVHSERTQELPNLLVVEDNAEMRVLLDSVLKDHFSLDFAKDGEEGEQKAVKNQPDLILSDIMMPKKDGFELLKTIKTQIETSHIPVVLLTAKSDNESRLEGFDQDADDYISKPFDPKILLARLQNLIRQRRHLHKVFSEQPFILSKNIKCTPLDAIFLKKVQSVLETHYSNGDFSVDEFCRELALNRNSVHNKIKAFTGQSTAMYIKNYRLNKSIELITGTHQSIADIYIGCGFNNSQAFNKAFKERFKVTPGEYRKKSWIE